MDNNRTLKLHVQSTEQADKDAHSLKNWLEQDDELDYQSIKQERAKLKEDEAGGALEATLAVVLGAPAIVQLVRSLHVWFQQRGQTERGKKLSVEIETPKGAKLKVEAQQLDENATEVIRELTALLKEDSTSDPTDATEKK